MTTVWDWVVERELDPVRVQRLLGELLAAPVRCDVRRVPGQFPTVVSCYRVPDHAVEWMVAARFSRAVGARCLLTDDTSHPYRFLLADPNGDVRPTHVDVDDLDIRNAFTLTHPCSTGEPSCRESLLCNGSRVPPDGVLTLAPETR